jgi:hypothetical protein
MVGRGKRAVALALVPAAFALALSACGGSDSSKETAGSDTAGTGATGATGASGASGRAGATGTKGSGGATAPSTSSSDQSKGNSTGGSSQSSSGTAGGAGGRHPSSKDKTQPNLKKLTPAERASLYKQSKQICQILGLQGLAHEYGVKATPDAVAKAYAKAYATTFPKNGQSAVYKGCRAGVS